MIAAYIRVSSRAQPHDMQRHAIEQTSRARFDTIDRWYAESKSGRSLDRPELNRLRQDVAAGKVQKLYVFKLDRLTRSGIRDTFELIEELQRHACQLVSVTDGFSLEGPAAEIILAVMAWAAKMERLAINERIAAARDRVESEGKKWGRPTVVTDALADRIVRLRKERHSLRAIAAAVGLPLATVARAVRRAALVKPQVTL